MMKKIAAALALAALVPAAALAAKSIDPVGNQTVTSVAGSDGTRTIIPILVDGAGRIVTVTSGAGALSVTNGTVTVTLAGPTNRTQLPSVAATGCSLQAHPSNAGKVYVGGSAVTNAAGANPGIELNPTEGYGSVTLANANNLYVAADNANDKVRFLCN